MIRRLLLPFTSLKLTIVCFAIAMVLIFLGTIEQVHLGIYGAQRKYFDSFLVFWTVPGTGRSIPVLPGGYLLGAVTLVNLLAAQAVRFKLNWRKSGIYFLHLGVILLLLGQLFTSLFAKEAQMRLDIGQTKNYAESFTEKELVLIDTSDPAKDRVLSIPEALLRKTTPIVLKNGLSVVANQYFRNSTAIAKNQIIQPGIPQLPLGPEAVLVPIATSTTTDQPNLPSAEITIRSGNEAPQSFIVSESLRNPKTFRAGGKSWRIDLRARRFYKPYSVRLEDFTHKIYPGTDIPKDFSSRVQILAGPTDKRDALVYMNHPLRYNGTTFYQLAFDNNDTTSILQVVRNPSWLLPYISCTLVALGLLVQFGIHLFKFAGKRKIALT